MMASLYTWLEQQGYHCYGPHDLKSNAILFQKRRHDVDGESDTAQCHINIWDYPPLPEYNLHEARYEVEVYWETPTGYAANLTLYTFTAETLQAQLAELEAVCVTLWQTYSRREEA